MADKSVLSKWLSKKKLNEVSAEADRQRPNSDWAPLSYGQQQIWLLQKLYPDTPFYNNAEVYHFEGLLEVESLIEAYRLITKRHDILRTVFQEHNGGVQLHVQDNANFGIKVIDLSSSAPTRETVREYLLREASPLFDLTEGPLSRLCVIKIAENDHWLQLCFHHIVTDNWSMKVLRQELADNYRNLVAGNPVVTPPLPLQYGDFSYQQRVSKVLKEEVDYWQEKLDRAPSHLPLAVDRPFPNQPSFKGHYHKRAISVSLTEAIRDFSTSTQTTIFNVLLSAYKILLWQRSGQADVSVGTPVSNRSKLELEQLIGYFNDTLVLRDQIDENLTFLELLRNVKQTTLAAFEHKNITFEQIVRNLQVPREVGRNPLFQHMFVYHQVPEKPDFGSGLNLDHQSLDLGVAKFELTLYITDREQHLESLMEFASDIFDLTTIERLQDHFIQILQEVTNNPNKQLRLLRSVSTQEHQSLLTYEQGVTIASRSDTVIAQMLETSQNYPDQIAVSYHSKTLSYKQLAERSKQLAQRLLAKGLKSGQLVGLHTSRSIEMIIGIWGILRAGGVYLPMDPAFPHERLNFMIQDAKIEIIVSNKELKIRQFKSHKILFFDESEAISDITLPKIHNSQPAYLIYTSGSSGQPKGVLVDHSNLFHSTAARTEFYPKSPDSFLLLSSFSFDSSIAGIFWTNCTGGELVIAPQRIEQDLIGLATIIQDRQVSHTLLLPSLYEAIISFVSSKQLKSLKTIIVAGEACSPQLVNAHFKQLPSCGLYNEYGPTEATVWCSATQLYPREKQDAVPIGRPVPGYEILILDKNLQRLPIGVAGELFVGGFGLTKGYWERPDLTAKRYIPHPFADNQQLYRTGDLAKWTNEGNLIFLGRLDEQIKIRGHRVELGEIQSVLKTSTSISDAVVVFSDNQQLVAYLTGKFEEKKLRVFLHSQLPAYMVPRFFVGLEEFPRLPNGKLDRNALPSLQQIEVAPSKVIQLADLKPAEAKLLEIWKEVLGTDQFGIDDNFFEIGGDSILSIKIVARAREAGIQLAPTAIFEQQTIARLALFASQQEGISGLDQQTDIEVGALLPIQHWFFSEHKNANHFWNQIYQLQLKDKNIDQLWVKLLPAVVQKHPILKSRFKHSSRAWRMQLDEDVKEQEYIELLDFRLFSSEQAEEQLLQELVKIQRSRKLEDGPLFWGVYVRMPMNIADRILLIAHHLLVDAVSWSIIWQDVEIGLASLQQGQPVDLGNPEKIYFNWANQLEQWSSKSRFKEALNFWQAQTDTPLVDGIIPNYPLLEENTQTTRLQLDGQVATGLLGPAHIAYNTNTEVLLICALSRALKQAWQQEHLCLQVEHHGREAALNGTDFSQAVGWFTTTFPIHIDIQHAEDIGAQILVVKEQLMLIPEGGLSYGVLRYLTKAPLLNQMPAIHFNYLGRRQDEDSIAPTALFDVLRHPKSERYRRWEINVWQLSEQLVISWNFDNQLELPDKMEKIQTAFLRAIQEITEHCLEAKERQYSPSDFPESGINQDDLDQLLSQLDI